MIKVFLLLHVLFVFCTPSSLATSCGGDGVTVPAFSHKGYVINLLSKEIKVSFAGLIYMRKDTLPLYINPLEQIKAIKANDASVLKALYQDNYYKTENYILKNNGTEDQAKDIYQEAFIAVWRNIQLDKFNPENETALAGYLFQVSKNKWLDYLRSSHHKKVVPIDYANIQLRQEDPLPVDENEYLLAVKNNFKNLGDNCKEVLTRFYYQKQSLKEIAKVFDWTEGTARNNKYRCVQRLREMFKNDKKVSE